MKSILLVDDSATMLMSLRQTLEMSGFKVETACDGVDALGKLKNIAKPDLIITDINMPRLDGFGLIERLREGSRHRDRPILVLTTESSDEKKARARAAGASGAVGTGLPLASRMLASRPCSWEPWKG